MAIKLNNIRLWLYILVVCAVLRSVFFAYNLHAPLSNEQILNYQVSPGQSLTRVLNDLEGRGILRNSFDLLLWARISNQDRIRAGEYALTPGLEPLVLLDKLIAGDVLYHQLVLLEGWTVQQALDSIQNNANITVTLQEHDPEILQQAMGIDRHPEGMIFPDTYNFTRGTSDLEILRRANRLLEQVLEQEWQARDVGLPYDGPYQALIMASIIEKETAVAAEREQIAGVFVRRLQRGMRLQTDPTVIYGLGALFDGDLTRADLRRQSPYNTYLNNGLPPTPIALAGREAIAASLHPEQGDTLYFVARGDGSHQFSATLEEHNAAVQRYQINREPVIDIIQPSEQ